MVIMVTTNTGRILVRSLAAIVLLLSPASGFSSGSGPAQTCDALGVCGVTEPRECPPGMHLVAPPTRSNNYSVTATTYSTTGTSPASEWAPGELVNIHVNVVHPDMKYIGLLLYAVDANENKVGEWDIPLENPPVFHLPNETDMPGCGAKAVMQSGAELKRYEETLRFRGPGAGAGTLTIRCLVKQGETNGGCVPPPTCLWSALFHMMHACMPWS